MASATAAVLYTLITVTNGGDVGHSSGYNSLRLCEEARSVAVSGHTIEQNEEEQARLAAIRKKQEEERRAPPQGNNGVTTILGGPSSGTFSSWPPPPGNIKYAQCVIEP